MSLSVIHGLTDAEVAQRVADGQSNAVRKRATRSITDIVRTNVFTRINAILGVLLLIVLSTGSLINGNTVTSPANGNTAFVPSANATLTFVQAAGKEGTGRPAPRLLDTCMRLQAM